VKEALLPDPCTISNDQLVLIISFENCVVPNIDIIANLDILRKYIDGSSIDLIYLDPPFNSNATYNVLFKEPSGESSQAQISAFEDTWH
jgi:16S rRNA G966 N2-methylase RsmD